MRTQRAIQKHKEQSFFYFIYFILLDYAGTEVKQLFTVVHTPYQLVQDV